MARDAEKMVPSTVSFTQRQTSDLKSECKKRGITLGELMRRIVDDWRDKHPTPAAKFYGQSAP